MENQTRLKSLGAWGATVALILFVLKTYFNVTIPEADKLWELILLAGAGWGIWNNPTSPNKF